MTAGKRKRILMSALALVIAGALLGGGWALAQLFRSPQQIAAESAEPPPALVTAPVLEGKLSREISLQAAVDRTKKETVVLPAQSGDVSVITKSPLKKGDSLSAGALVVEINGQPLFYLPGRFVYYRDIYTGDRGPDVEQLQRALSAAGYNVTPDGVAGGQTLRAMRQLYANAGYKLPVLEAEPEPQEEPQLPEADAEAPPPRVPAKPKKSPPILVLTRVHAAVGSGNPTTIEAIPAVGASGEDAAAATVLSGGVRLEAEVSSDTAVLLRPGMPAHVSAEGEKKYEVTVDTVAPEASESGTIAVTFVGDDKELQELPLGENALILMNLADGTDFVEGTVIVPSLSVIMRGGTSFVRKWEKGDTFREVVIQEIENAGGQSAVAPRTPGELVVGDTVRVQ